MALSLIAYCAMMSALAVFVVLLAASSPRVSFGSRIRSCLLKVRRLWMLRLRCQFRR